MVDDVRSRIERIINEINDAYFSARIRENTLDAGINGVDGYLAGVYISSDTSIEEMVAYMRGAAYSRGHMRNYKLLLNQIESELIRRGESQEQINKLLRGLE